MQLTFQSIDMLLAGRYQPPAGFRDELVDKAGNIRPYWLPIIDKMAGLGIHELRRREEQLNRIIREHGVTFNIYGQADGKDRPWVMDLLPTVVPYEEWKWLEESLRQRVTLINSLLADIYGERRLLKSGAIPQELLFANPEYLRPCVGWSPVNGHHVHIYAADLARSPDGHWWVLSDRLESPSGMGYSHENRLLTRRLLGDLFRTTRVQPLQPFFDKLQSSFSHLAPWADGDPKVVYLTPGPANETYFEQSYLSRNLGYPIVQGADLMVWNNRVYLKTLGGSQPVDVIIRRVDSAYCDPLDFRADSLLGVPGLVEAARAGNVALANALGTGILEATAWLAFYPALCQTVLGESLKIPSVATWWCGQESERKYVLEHLDDLIIKPAFRTAPFQARWGGELSKEDKDDLRQRILAQPAFYCAQELVNKSTTPVLEDAGLIPRHFLTRVYLVRGHDGYFLMPGGLTRIASNNHPLTVSMQRGGQSKDTWILQPPTARVDDLPPIPGTVTMAIRRARTDVPSRVADNLFWFGRYLERCDAQARLIRVLINALTEESEERLIDLLPMFAMLQDWDVVRKQIKSKTFDMALADSALGKGLWDAGFVSSVTATAEGLHRCAFAIKDRLSLDLWQTLTRLREVVQQKDFDSTADSKKHSVLEDSVFGQLSETLNLLAAASGLATENMTRGQGWVFLDLGRRIERGLSLCDLLQTGMAFGPLKSESLLQKYVVWADSILTYRRRYLAVVQILPALDLLLLDPANPRALSFQTSRILQHTARLPYVRTEGISPQELAEAIHSRIGVTDLAKGPPLDTKVGMEFVSSFLDFAGGQLRLLSERFSQIYFAQGAGAMPMGIHNEQHTAEDVV